MAAGCRSVEGWRLGLVASGMMYGACAIYVCLCAKSIGKEKDLEEEVRHVLHARTCSDTHTCTYTHICMCTTEYKCSNGGCTADSTPIF